MIINGKIGLLEEKKLDVDDLEPKNEKPKPINLEVMSIEALQKYIEELEDEINRVNQEIKAKEAGKESAARLN